MKALLFPLLFLLSMFMAACQSPPTETTSSESGRSMQTSPTYRPSTAGTPERPSVTVLGRVKKPGTYTINRYSDLATVLNNAGWNPMIGGYDRQPVVIINRVHRGYEDEWVMKLNYVYNPSWLAFDLRDGDIIRVKHVLISGES